MVKSWGEKLYHEDLVQEMYLRVDRYCTEDKTLKDGKVNKPYINFVLRSIFIDYCKSKSVVNKQSIDGLDFEQPTYETENANEKIHLKLLLIMDKWTWYDKEMYRLNVLNKIPMREISKNTTITLSSIFKTIKSCKRRIRKELYEDYEDYINQDYERI